MPNTGNTQHRAYYLTRSGRDISDATSRWWAHSVLTSRRIRLPTGDLQVQLGTDNGAGIRTWSLRD